MLVGTGTSMACPKCMWFVVLVFVRARGCMYMLERACVGERVCVLGRVIGFLIAISVTPVVKPGN